MVSSHLDPPDTTPSGSDSPATTDDKPADAGEPEPAVIPEQRSGKTSEPGPARMNEPADRVWSGLVTALSYSPATPRGWLLMAAGIGGTLLIATSYPASWLTATLEHRDGVDSHAMALHEVTTTPLAWMYRIATLGMIACALALVFVPRAATPPLRIVGFTAAGLSLYSAMVATLVITNVGGALNGAMTVRYGLGLYAGYLGIAGLGCFIGLFGRLGEDRSAVTR
jgi:hypothetical protein